MRKKFLAAVLCLTMGLAVCACKTTTPTGSENPTQGATEAPQATVTTAPTDEEAETLPISDYDDYVTKTTLADNYVGLEMEKVTEDEVEAYIQEVLAGNKERELKDGPIEKGDIAIIDYTGYLDGVAFEGGADAGFEMVVGETGFIDGFEDGMIGAKKGETISLELTFPDPYRNNPDLAGKDVVFEVKIHSVAAQVLPEFSDEFVTNLTGGEYTSAEAFREYALGLLTEEKKYLTVMDYLVENSVFTEVNEEYIMAVVDSMKSYYEYYSIMFGYTSLDEFMADSGVEDAEAFWNEMEAQTRREEQERVILYCVAKAENMTLTDDEFTKSATELAASYGATLEAFMAEQGEKAIRQTIMMESALNYLMDNVIVKGEE